MKLNFTKMHGCGNDYIYFDCVTGTEIQNPSELSVNLSRRHFGIGADGIILICKSDVADAKMRMFNADGSEGKMCGNGIRCVGKYLYDHKIVPKDTITIETLSGTKTLKIQAKDNIAERVTVNMGIPVFEPGKIPVKIKKDKIINYPAEIDGMKWSVNCVSMGNPHCVIFCDDIENLNIEKIGPAIENSGLFPEKANVEFVKLIDKNTICMRVWERGSGETLACGTGACASVVMAIKNGYCQENKDVIVRLRGGDLTVKYTGDSVYMTGKAEVAFEGVVEI